MSDVNPQQISTSVPLDELASILGTAPRWVALKTLASSPQALPVSVLAEAAGISANAMSHQMTMLRYARLVVTGYGGLYSIAPAFRPAPGATTLDLGHCLLRLDRPAPG